jgi:uncharacterized membrane protein
MTSQPSPGIGKGRIEALADGIFAIAMTLLILDVKVPALEPAGGSTGLAQKIVQIWPKFVAFGVSFLIIGVFWVGHHAQFHYVRRSDRLFLWMNLVFLMVISAIPFSAALLGAYHNDPIAVVFYCGNMIVGGVVLFAQLRYAAGPGQLLDADLDRRFVRVAGQRTLMGPVLYLIAIGLAFINTNCALFICALVPILYVLPGRVDSYWKHKARQNSQKSASAKADDGAPSANLRANGP